MLVVMSVNHLGLPQKSSQGNAELMEERVSKGRRVMNAYVGVTASSINPANPLTLSKIYWSVAVPSITYGLEVIPIKDADLEKLDKGQREAAKRVQGLPPNTSNPACLAQLGWRKLSTKIYVAKLMFLWQILSLAADSVYKKVTVIRLTKLEYSNLDQMSPLWNIVSVAKKFGLFDSYRNMINSGIIPPKEAWKRQVKNVVMQHERNQWKIELLMYKKVDIYMCVISEIKPNSWWLLAKKYPSLIKQCKIIMQLIVGEGNLRVNVGIRCERNKRDVESLCKMCEAEAETLNHMILKCPAHQSVRESLMAILSDYNLDELSDDYKVRFILDEASILDDKEKIHVLKHISDMYKSRDC